MKYCIFGPGEKEGKVTTVVATPGHGSDRQQEISYTDTRVIGKSKTNGPSGIRVPLVSITKSLIFVSLLLLAF